jgi:enamine deaminase RidA (YjgF/YER057c/UK114 family)
MGLEYIAPEGVHEARGYTHVVKAKCSTIVYISGQVGVRPDGSTAEGLEEQSKQAYANLAACLKSVGAGPEHVAKLNTYVVDYSPEKREAVSAGRRTVFGDRFPASTLVGVQALAMPQLQIEVEAVVLLD